MSDKGKSNGIWPVHHIASELGVDRMFLTRALKSQAIDFDKGITFRQAYGVLSGKFEEETSRRRKQDAEAKSAEIDAAEKAGMFVLKSEHERVVAEIAVQTRVELDGFEEISKELRVKLSKKLAGIKIK